MAERLAAEILSLPMFPEITAEQQEHVVATLALARRRWGRPAERPFPGSTAV